MQMFPFLSISVLEVIFFCKLCIFLYFPFFFFVSTKSISALDTYHQIPYLVFFFVNLSLSLHTHKQQWLLFVLLINLPHIFMLYDTRHTTCTYILCIFYILLLLFVYLYTYSQCPFRFCIYIYITFFSAHHC